MANERDVPIGAEIRGNKVHFRVWAPLLKKINVVIETGRAVGEYPLSGSRDGYFSGSVSSVAVGDRYRFRLEGESVFPDPASRFQPEGPHGPSQIVDPAVFKWTDSHWKGQSLLGQVIYEMHIGTFTREGTWSAATRELSNLVDLGVTVIEVMPVADFPGRFGWGYDGVFLFAPTRLYGPPDDFRQFTDRAHSLGLGVILDVVYNHLGPDGNVLHEFCPHYFSDRHHTDWGKALNFDGPYSEGVREFFLDNARYWIEDFHLDGLRLDATQTIFDDSEEHILKAVGQQVREAARGRSTIVIQEDESQDSSRIRPIPRGGQGLDGAWNDDFHHSAMVAMTGRKEAYYLDYRGNPQEFISSVKYGYLFQGQRYSWQEKRRGSLAFDIEPWQFVNFLQNHDQVANSGKGRRCHQLTSPGRMRALTALLLLSPCTPFLFQGQEFASLSPFLYFADHEPELARKVREGRAEFLSQFRRLDHKGLEEEIPDPASPNTFERCKLDFEERRRHAEVYRLHKDLIALRKSDPAFSTQRKHGVDGAVLGERAFVLRYFAGERADRLLLINLSSDLYLNLAPEPLLAPPPGCGWDILLSTEDRPYGGEGTSVVETLDGWRLMGDSAIVLAPTPRPVAAGAKEFLEERKRRERTRLGE